MVSSLSQSFPSWWMATAVYLSLVTFTNASHADVPEWEKPIYRTLACETCQALTEILSNELIKEVPKMPKTLGSLDIIIQDLLDPSKLCTFGHFSDYAEKSEQFQVYQMTQLCSHFTDEQGEEYEESLPKLYKDQKALRTRFCSSKCASEGLWTEDNHPLKREGTKARNQRLAKAFMESNENQEGVKKTESGLQYKVLLSAEDDSAVSPKMEQMVTVSYQGKLLDGTIFDSTLSTTSGDILNLPENPKTTDFRLDQVVKGFGEGIQLMKPNDIFELYIPPTLGYGTMGSGDKIPANSLLIFQVKLHSFTDAPNEEPPKFDPSMMQQMMGGNRGMGRIPGMEGMDFGGLGNPFGASGTDEL